MLSDVWYNPCMPYIPEDHQKYNLLPLSTECGGEVFYYPSDLVDEIGSYYPEGIHFIPYGYDSYDAYFEYLEGYRKQCNNDDLKRLFDRLKKAIIQYNQKEDWSICRYIGKGMSLVSGLTPGRCYYWPCCKDDPVYDGVIDDEEFTSYWYPTDEDLWEIVLDPTGMAYDALHNPDKRNKKKCFNGVMRSLNGDGWTDV